MRGTYRRWSTAILALSLCASVAACSRAETEAAPQPYVVHTTVSAPPAPEPSPTRTLAPGESLIATATGPQVDVYAARGDATPARTFASPNDLGATRVFLVTEEEGDWLHVYLPARPNESTGWVKSDDVTLSTTSYHVVVTLADFQLRVFSGEAEVLATTVVLGKTSTPTPPGHFYVTEVVNTGNPGGAYGPFALGLSGYSDVLTQFNGGPGQLAVHGTNAPGRIGTAASNGCVRIANDVVTKLAELVPVGTPVTIED